MPSRRGGSTGGSGSGTLPSEQGGEDYVGVDTGFGIPTRPRNTNDGTSQDVIDFNDPEGSYLKLLNNIFNKQFDYLDDRQELWDSYRGDVEKILEESPEYEIPNVIKELTDNLQNTADAVRDNYDQASDDLKTTVKEGIGRTLEVYSTNLKDALSAVQQGGQAGLKNFQDAYDVANKSADDILSTANTGYDSIVKLAQAGGDEYKQIVEQGVTPYLAGNEQSANKIRDLATQGISDTLSTAQQGIDTTVEGLDTALKSYGQGATTIRDLYKQTLQETNADSDQALLESLAGTDKMLSIYKDQAAGGLPGQSLLEGKLDQQSAEALTRIKNLSGGRGGLSAIAETYQNRQEGYQDIAIQAAQYKNQVKRDLANAYQTAGQSKSAAYSDRFGRTLQSGQFGISAEQAATEMEAGAQERIAVQKGNAYLTQAQLQQAAAEMGISAEELANSVTSESQLNALSARMGASEYATGLNLSAEQARTEGLMGAVQTASGMRTDALNNLGQYNRQIGLDEAGQLTTNASLMGAAQRAGYQDMGNAIVTGANMVNTGQMQGAALESEAANTLAAYEDQQFQYNEWQPYQNKLNYYANMASQTDPLAYQMGAYGDVAGVNLAQYQGALESDAAKKAANAQLWGSILGVAGKIGAAFI